MIEPGAPPPSARLEALKQLAEAGIYTGILMMPILPFIEDTWENISSIVRKSYGCGAKFIIPWFGMTLRDRQRSHYYSKLDIHFNGLRRRYEREYSSSYSCTVKNSERLSEPFGKMCANLGITCDMKNVRTHRAEEACYQMSLFN